MKTFFRTTIETGPLYLDINVEINYEASGPSYGPTIEINDIEPDEEMDASLWLILKPWVMKTYRDRLLDEARTLADNNDMDRRARDYERLEYQKVWRAVV